MLYGSLTLILLKKKKKDILQKEKMKTYGTTGWLNIFILR